MYGVEALRRLRERQSGGSEPALAPAHIDVPPEAPIDDAALSVWNGERFVAWKQWLATAPYTVVEAPIAVGPGFGSNVARVSGDCAGRPVWLLRDGERWLMYVGSKKARHRRRDFATPYLEHAIRTAEQWYGAPEGGWRAEETPSGERIEQMTHEAAHRRSA